METTDILKNITNYGTELINNLEEELKKDKNTTSNKVKSLSNDVSEVIDTYSEEGFEKAAVVALDNTLENVIKYTFGSVGQSAVDIKNAFEKEGVDGGVEQIITECLQQVVESDSRIKTVVKSALKIKNAFEDKGLKEGIKVAFKEGIAEVFDSELISEIYKNSVEILKEGYDSVKEKIFGSVDDLTTANELIEYWNNAYKAGDIDSMNLAYEKLKEELSNVSKQENKDKIIEVLLNHRLIEAKIDWWTARLEEDKEKMELASAQGKVARSVGATISEEEITFVDVAYRQILNLLKESKSPIESSVDKNLETLDNERNYTINEEIFKNGNTIQVNESILNDKISTNFKLSEFISSQTQELIKSGTVTQINLSSDLIDKLEKLREIIGNAYNTDTLKIQINSGYRTSEDNKRVNGAHKSQHLEGGAADIVAYYTDSNGEKCYIESDLVATFAKDAGFTGIGIYENFVHVDIREKSYYWNNK